MNFILGFDNGYCPFAATTIASVCKNNVGHHNFYAFINNISNENRTKLINDVTKFGSSISFINITQKDVAKFPIGAGTANDYVSIATYFRLFITSKLPIDVQRVIYLDCDVIVDANISEIWNWKFSKGKFILAADDYPTTAENSIKRLGIDTYFNAGVFVIDVSVAKKYINEEVILQYLIDNKKKIKFHDQDILNALLHDKRELMPIRYNVLNIYYKKKFSLPKCYNDTCDFLENPAIIHFSSRYKPWHTECTHPLINKFETYISLTSYANYTKHSAHPTLFHKWIFNFKSLVYSILTKLKIINN